jgi:hypothetical protein
MSLKRLDQRKKAVIV